MTTDKFLSFLFPVAALVCVTTASLRAQSTIVPDDPSGNAGALKPRIETAGGYNAHNGNASRSITDLHVPGSVGDGLEFTRHWNSTDTSFTVPQQLAGSFGKGGWTHSWQWTASYDEVTQYREGNGASGGSYSTTGVVYSWNDCTITVNYPDGRSAQFRWIRPDTKSFHRFPQFTGWQHVHR